MSSSAFLNDIPGNSGPLAGRRLIVTLPPEGFFGGVERQRAFDQVRALRQLGAKLYLFETSRVYRGDLAGLQDDLASMRAFNADAVVGAQHAGYALQGGMVAAEIEGEVTNLFLDVLELPTLLYWDQALTQAARYVLPSYPAKPDESRSGALGKLRELMAHPLVVHFFPDSGHKAEFERLGILGSASASVFITAVSDDFVAFGKTYNSVNETDRLAFFGNIYLAASKELSYGDEPELTRIRQAALQACGKNWDLPVAGAYRDALIAVGDSERARLMLDPDQSFYWRFLFDELSLIANGEHRLSILSSANLPIVFYGGFADLKSAEMLRNRGWAVRSPLPHDERLARAYSGAALTLDVVNAPFVNGFSPKLLECFAAGGFMLTTRKADMKTAFGGIADLIGYSNQDELNAKIDHYLVHEDERREITREMQAIIRRDHTAAALFAKTVPATLA